MEGTITVEYAEEPDILWDITEGDVNDLHRLDEQLFLYGSVEEASDAAARLCRAVDELERMAARLEGETRRLLAA